MTAPQVSIVLPTYNRAQTLPGALDSVLAQTFADLELIVVDDGSSDSTAEVLSRIDDPRLVTIRLEVRHGAAKARNAGIRKARGTWIAFQDSDDEWLPDKLERQLSLAREVAGLRAVGGRYLVGAAPAPVHVVAPRLETGEDYEAELLDGPCCITPVWLIQRSLLDELGLFDERMPCLEDWDLMLRLSRRSPMRAVPHDVLIKGGAPNSLGGDPSRRRPAMAELLRRHGSRFLAHPRRHASFCLELAYLSMIDGHPRDALRYAGRSLRRRGATGEMLLGFARDCLTARRHGPIWPMPSQTVPH